MTYRPDAVTVQAPAFSTLAEAQSWAEQALNYLKRLQLDVNKLTIEARKHNTTDLSGTVDTGDPTTDGIIENIIAALRANGLAAEEE